MLLITALRETDWAFAAIIVMGLISIRLCSKAVSHAYPHGWLRRCDLTAVELAAWRPAYKRLFLQYIRVTGLMHRPDTTASIQYI